MNEIPNQSNFSNRPSEKLLKVRVAGENDLELRGRPAWTLQKLMAAGNSGITTAELPAGLRLSHYILILRKSGIRITTQYEDHGGAFAGRHARYRLASDVSLLNEEVAA